jgi:hypothetical protein
MDKQAEAEFRKWYEAKYPYDMAKCGYCATTHAMLDGCRLRKHKEMRRMARTFNIYPWEDEQISEHDRQKILAFRKRFAEFYPIIKNEISTD